MRHNGDVSWDDAIETDRDLERLFDGEPDEEVTILIEDEGVPSFEESPGPTEVMTRPPVFVAQVRVPAPGLPMLIEEAPDSEPHTLTGLHGLHDLIADDSQQVPAVPEEVATPIFYARVRTSTQKMPSAPLPSVVIETASSIAPLAFDVDETTVPREIVLRSVLSSAPPPPPFDHDRSDATTVLPRPPARRSPFVGAAIGLAAAIGIAATFAVVMTWRTSTGPRRAAAAGRAPAVATANAVVDAGH